MARYFITFIYVVHEKSDDILIKSLLEDFPNQSKLQQQVMLLHSGICRRLRGDYCEQYRRIRR